MKTIYKFYFKIKVNCNGIIEHVGCIIKISAESYDEAKRILKENITFELEEPIQLLYEQ